MRHFAILGLAGRFSATLRNNDGYSVDINYSVFPFSEPVYGSEEELELEDTVSDGFDLEEYVTDSVLIDEIREAVKKRNVWEIDFFDYCLNGSFRSCNKEMREKYGISHETLNRRKQKFILFLKNFLKGVEK